MFRWRAVRGPLSERIDREVCPARKGRRYLEISGRRVRGFFSFFFFHHSVLLISERLESGGLLCDGGPDGSAVGSRSFFLVFFLTFSLPFWSSRSLLQDKRSVFFSPSRSLRAKGAPVVRRGRVSPFFSFQRLPTDSPPLGMGVVVSLLVSLWQERLGHGRTMRQFAAVSFQSFLPLSPGAYVVILRKVISS